MSKEICMHGWVSIIPNKLYDSFVKRGYLAKGVTDISEGTDEPGRKTWMMRNASTVRCAFTAKEVKSFIGMGYKKDRQVYFAKKAHFDKMNIAIRDWYKKVFDYVEKWLKEQKLISLKSGSFDGGFCAETDPNSEVVKLWGAPLQNENNKVAQIKEKFGRITVYFNGLTTEERAKVEKFAKTVEKKWDCVTVFC